ncbi:uncharacterized protein LOC132589012 [Heteronotia binoei]|uniref:uncharacterized protein LOC132589012 n=1 Tax=Heteronotia binoei TaxID=13085 RepID=UPI00292E925F|nr:uncharacterized protein LOC132589012 [Heteronotia binoei]
MGNNHSKLCSGFPERECRRAQQDWSHQVYMMQQGNGTLPDTAETELHINCCEGEVDQYLAKMNKEPIVFHFKVKNPLKIKPENFPEGGEKSGAATAVLVGAMVAEPGGDVTENLEPSGGVLVRSGTYGDIMMRTGAGEELHSTLACLCDQVVHALQVVGKSSKDSSEGTKGHSTVENLPPSSLESQPSIMSTISQTKSPSFGAVESLNAGDVLHSNEDTCFANDQKAPCGIDLELATGGMLGEAEEPTTGQMQLEEVFSKETPEEADETSSEDTLKEESDASSEETIEALPDLDTETMADESSDVETDLGTQEVAEILLNPGNDLPQAMSEPLPILNKREEKVPEDCCDGGDMDARLEVLPKRAQCEMLATVDSARLIASKIFQMDAHGSSVHSLCKKTRTDDVLLLVSDAADLDYFQKGGYVPTAEATKENERQMSVVQDIEAQPLADIAEMTGAASSPKAPSETAETGQGGPSSLPLSSRHK